MPDRGFGPLVRRTPEGETVGFSEGKPDPLVHVPYPVAARECRAAVLERGVEPGHQAFVHAYPVVAHDEDEVGPPAVRPLDAALDGQRARPPPLLYSVVDRVLDQGLQDQPHDAEAAEPLAHADRVLELALVAHLLDAEVALDVLELVRQGNDLPVPC